MAALSNSVQSLGADHLLERVRVVENLVAATGSTDESAQKNTVLEQLRDESSAAPGADVQATEVSESLVKIGAGVVLPQNHELEKSLSGCEPWRSQLHHP